MDRRGLLAVAAGIVGMIGVGSHRSRAEAAGSPRGPSQGHRLVLHVDRNDAAVMNLALGNAHNVAAHYHALGESLSLELVAYGPGIAMLRADASPVAERIAATRQDLPEMVFSACNNTLTALRKAEGRDIPLLPGVRIVPAGIVRLVELQEQGWSYVKP